GEELAPADMADHAMIAALRALGGELDEQPEGHERPAEDGIKGPIDTPPDLSAHDPADRGFVCYKDVAIMFSKRYRKDPKRYDVVKGT
ncbi:MAG: hypothetical protein NC311_20155, partial [Muribaculaceae bacterium]|nr:hypothetical protein [Muribaculaceae bacterium]